jgi:uracil-DNA glycosylase
MSQMTLRKFRSHLSEKMPDKSIRLFVCNGSPFDCRVVLVGINPAFSGFKKTCSFWNFWRDESGFDIQKWLNSFKKLRLKKGKSELTKTRNLIEHFRKKLEEKGIPLMDTNIYMKETSRSNQLKKSEKDTNTFWYLIKTIKPRIIILHGKKPIEHFEEKTGEKLLKHRNTDTPVNINVLDRPTKVFAYHHMSYQMSKDRLNKISDVIANNLT